MNGTTTIKPLNSIVDAVSRRLSDNLLLSSINSTNGTNISHSHPTISKVFFFFKVKFILIINFFF